MTEAKPDLAAYWSQSQELLLQRLNSTTAGLSTEQADQLLKVDGSRLQKPEHWSQVLKLFLTQFKSPIILILLGAATLSLFLGAVTDALIILGIVVASGLLGFWQEWGAADALRELLEIVQTSTTVLRGGNSLSVPVDQVMPGDVALLRAGDIIPGDGRLLEAKDLFVTEATLTGETFPVEKLVVDSVPPETPLAHRTNCLFLGSSVVSGTGRLLIVGTGRNTEFGKVSASLLLRPPETGFERGIRHFGYLLMQVTLLLVLAIFAINVGMHRPIMESFLFSVAIAVGLTPQLLPAIISVNLAHGARRMARQKVIVRRLTSIENLGAMDVLCSDKTGTLTEGKVRLQSALDANGAASDRTFLFAYLNAAFQSGYENPIDLSIINSPHPDSRLYHKLDEEPYDFVRKRLSVLVSGGDQNQIITKGSLSTVLDVCEQAENGLNNLVPISAMRARIEQLFVELSGQGLRTLGIAYRNLGTESKIHKGHESQMIFLGLLVFEDPLRPGIANTLKNLLDLGLATKIITGDNRLVAAHVASQAGLPEGLLITGEDLRKMSDDALIRCAGNAAVFAEVEPNQKERIILALKKSGYVVGYLGDGINDASALHAADVGISVADAVDVAKEASDLVLLEKDLGVLEGGIREGRAAFANTLKYIFMATSANFGNMFSMAGASLFLSYLPLLPKQVLLMNLFTDLPEMTIANDRVDPEMVAYPCRWDIRFIRRFMIVFGAVSSIFDFMTFGALLWFLDATEAQLRTGWFLESVVSASLIVLVIRTRRRLFQSQPGRALQIATMLVVGMTVLLPYTPVAPWLGFVPLPASFLLILGLIVLLYVITAEAAKYWFYRLESRHHESHRETRTLMSSQGLSHSPPDQPRRPLR